MSVQKACFRLDEVIIFREVAKSQMHVSLCRLITPSRSWSGSRSTAGPRMQVREISGSDCGDIMILTTETSTGQYLGKYGLLSDFVKIVFCHQLWLL